MNEHYSMVIEWSNEDQLYIVSLPEWGPGAKTHGVTYEEAARAGHELLETLLAHADAGEMERPMPRVYVAAG